MSLMDIATKLFMQHVGGSGDAGQIKSALESLLGGSNGDLDLMGLVSKFQSGGLAAMASSWLGDGANEGMSVDQVQNVFGGEKLGAFASQVGVEPQAAATGLQKMIPDLIDQSSSGGSLLDSVGGIGGAMKLAKGLLG